MKLCSLVAATAVVLCLSWPAQAGSVSVTVSGAVPNGTRVYVTLCAGDLDFASCLKGDYKPATAATLKFAFADVTPGRYAIAAFQDLDGSGTMERSKLGIPLEPFAFSNDAGRSRKPTFEAAAITIGDGARDIQLRLRGIARPAGDQ